MTEQPQQESRFRRFVRGVVRFVVRLVLLLLIFGLVGLAVYFGLPWLHRTYVQPLFDLQVRVQQLEGRVERVESQTAAVLKEWQQALQDLQEAQVQLQRTMQEIQQELDSVDETNREHQRRIEDLEQRLEQLGQAQEKLQATLSALDVRLSDLEAQWDSQWPVWNRIRSEALATRLLAQVLRAQMFLAQDNYAAARGELALLIETVVQRLPAMPPEQAAEWNEVLRHLEEAQEKLPEQPVQAQDHLDAVWNLLLTMQPEPPPSLQVNPFEGLFGPEEGTPTPTPEAGEGGE